MLSSSCFGLISVAANVDELIGFAFLTTPLQIVVYADVWDSEICAHMALVGVILAERY